MKKITITTTYRYSPDGLSVIELEPGVHELPEEWAQRAIDGGHCNKAKSKNTHNKAAKPDHNKN